MKKLIFFTALLFLLSCQKENIAITSIKLNETSLSIKLNDKFQLSVSHIPEDLPALSYKWETDNSDVVIVDNNGLITAISVGKAKITVKTETNLRATCIVSVTPIEAETFKLNKNDIALYIGDKDTITYNISPENTTNKIVTWESSDVKIASISSEGIISAVAVGKTTITGKTENNLTAECIVTVNAIKAEAISLNKKELTLYIGNKETLNYIITPENTTNKTVTWESSDDKIASISSEGIISAVAVGKITITAKTENNLTAECIVIVNPIAVSEINLNETNVTIEKTNRHQLFATILPQNATNKNILWESSNENIALVSNNGIVTGLKEGTARITAKSENKEVRAECIFTITPIKVKGISLDCNNVIMTVSESRKLISSVIPSNADNKKIRWSSSNPNIVNIDEYGNITALEIGYSNITATTIDGNYEANCKINVEHINNILKIQANGHRISQGNGVVNFTLNSYLSNPSSYPINVNSVILTDSQGYILDIQPGFVLNKESNNRTIFKELQIRTNSISSWFFDLISSYKVIYQFRFNNKEYHIEKNFNGNVWG